MPRFRMLSIDGGGIRGLIPALVLEELERRLERPLYSVFDVIAGTSTGGIITLGLTTARRVPRASELVALVGDETSSAIFTTKASGLHAPHWLPPLKPGW